MTRDDAIRAVSDALIALRRIERSAGDGRTVHGVTPAQGALVHEAVIAEGPAHTRYLAARLGISSPAVTQLVDGLVAQGIVQRTPDPDDGRRTLIELTDLGSSLYRGFDGARLAQTERLLQPLDDCEAELLARLLTRLTCD